MTKRINYAWVRERKVKSSSRPDSSEQTLVGAEEEISQGWGQSKLGVLSRPHNGRACPPISDTQCCNPKSLWPRGPQVFFSLFLLTL